MSQITLLLCCLHSGDENARHALYAAAYKELWLLARAHLRNVGRNATMDTTSLLHDSYLRFAQGGPLRAQNRRAFFAYASRVMRSVILDNVRERHAERRGAGVPDLPLTTDLAASLTSNDQTGPRVREAIETLEQADARLAQVVKMRFFAGHTMKEIAGAMQTTERTVQRDWEKARLILAAVLRQDR